MRFDRKDRDVALVRAVGPENPSCSGRVVFEIGLENLQAVLAAQVADLVGGETVVPGICRQLAEHFDQLLKKLLLVLAKTARLLPRGEILPESLHLGLAPCGARKVSPCSAPDEG